MDIDDIKTLYAYNRWANQRMFSALEKLSDQQFAARGAEQLPLHQGNGVPHSVCGMALAEAMAGRTRRAPPGADPDATQRYLEDDIGGRGAGPARTGNHCGIEVVRGCD